MTAVLDATHVLDPRSSLWGAPPLPDWVTEFRPHQIAAIEEILSHYDNGADVVMVDAPTGAGKTLIAESIRRLLDVQRCLYVANTKGLQDQFYADFPYAKVLKGRSNYPTLDHPERFNDVGRWRLTAGDCNKSFEDKIPSCSWCSAVWDCPYEKAKSAALRSRLAITNTAYFVAECNGPGKLVQKEIDGRRFHAPLPLVVVDECDTLEAILMGQIELVIPKKWMAKLKLTPPEKKTVAESWLEWFDDVAIPRLKQARSQYAINLEAVPVPDVEMQREAKYVENLYGRVQVLRDEVLAENVVYDGYGDDEVRFKPIRVDKFGPDRIWRHGTKWLLMSATIIDPAEFAESVGIDDAGLRWEVVSVPSTFPVENRPIYFEPVANMVFKEKDVAWPDMAKGVSKVLEKHPDERILVHTVSYGFAKFLHDELRDLHDRPIMRYDDARQRETALELFRNTDAAVLLAPSMDRGVDLPHDDCRVVVVTKMPFLSTQDKQVKARMYTRNGRLWYSVQTVRSLIQMTGRAMRAADDCAITYILDRQFRDNVWKNSRRLLPAWWVEALDWVNADL